MNRILFIGYALFALLSFAVLSPSQSLAQLGPHLATGNWTVHASGPGYFKGPMHMVQQGYTVVGNAQGPKREISFSGKLNNDTLSGTWRGPTGETGWLTFTFARTFMAFNGEWGYHGRTPEGTVIGKMSSRTR